VIVPAPPSTPPTDTLIAPLPVALVALLARRRPFATVTWPLKLLLFPVRASAPGPSLVREPFPLNAPLSVSVAAEFVVRITPAPLNVNAPPRDAVAPWYSRVPVVESVPRLMAAEPRLDAVASTMVPSWRSIGMPIVASPLTVTVPDVFLMMLGLPL